MGESSDGERHPGGNRSAEQLGRIAEVLGLPVATFFDDGAASTDEAGLGALLRLWSALDHEVDRHRVLALMRRLANG